MEGIEKSTILREIELAKNYFKCASNQILRVGKHIGVNVDAPINISRKTIDKAIEDDGKKCTHGETTNDTKMQQNSAVKMIWAIK